jgi:hypothetical protein
MTSDRLATVTVQPRPTSGALDSAENVASMDRPAVDRLKDQSIGPDQHEAPRTLSPAVSAKLVSERGQERDRRD